MMRDLAALTPPLVVCAAILIGIVALLRREMGPRRRAREDSAREDSAAEDGNSADSGIIETKIPGPVPAEDLDDATGSRDVTGRSG